MEVREIGGSSGYQAYLQLALDDAVSAYQETHEAVSCHPPLTEETATPELTLLHYALEQRRATALVLAACCVEALANLYLAQKTTPEQFAILEWARFLDKWTVLPSLFLPGYTFPKDGELYQDLKRLNARRNALVHLKEEVSRDGAVLHPGSHPDTASDENVFIGKCRSLPDRLLAHLASFDQTEAIKQVNMVLAIAPVMREMRRLTAG
jgi:hypothetical protein